MSALNGVNFNDAALKGSVYKGPKFCRFGLKGRVIFKTFVFAQKKKKKEKKEKKPSNFLTLFW